MSKPFLWKAFVLCVLVFPAAQADVTGTKKLNTNQTLNLDAGTTGTSGGNLLWTGSQIQFQGAAEGYDLQGFNPFSNVTEMNVSAAASFFTTSNITPSVNDVIAVKTNGGNYAAVGVTAISGSSITLQYVTYGASSTSGGPTISAVINNYSGIVPGLPSYGIAPGSIFVIYGTGMSDNVPLQLQSSVGGLPTTLNGASISVTVGGKTVTPAIYYAIPTQIAAVLPSSTPTGSDNLTLTYNGQSTTVPIQVTASAFGLANLNGAGTGGIIATDYPAYNLITPTHSAAPGQVLILWGSGLGADTNNNDRTFPNQQDNLNNATVYIGGMQANVAYAGRSQFPGVDQINITVPQGLSGCGVSVAVVAGGKVSNFGTLPINPGNGVCHDTFGLDGTQLLQSGPENSGVLGLLQDTFASLTSYSAYANFSTQFRIGEFGSMGSCLVSFPISVGGFTGLDAGSITLTGGGLNVQLKPTQDGTSYAQLTNPLMSGTAYTFSNGSGGANIGPFSSTITFPVPVTWTNESSISTVTEASGQLITWSGDTPGTYVSISGGSSVANGSIGVSFICYAPVGDQQFTVPSYVLMALPTGTGNINVSNSTFPAPFTATGLDYGSASATITVGENVTYQ